MPKFTGKKRTFMNNPPFLSKGEGKEEKTSTKPRQSLDFALGVGEEGSGITKAQYNTAKKEIQNLGLNPVHNYGKFVTLLKEAGATNIPTSINAMRI